MITTYHTTIRILLATLFLLACMMSITMAQADSLTASVDRSQLGSGETFELRVKYGGQTTSDPDFSPLYRDFEVLSQHQQTRYSRINSSTTSYTEWILQLLPRSAGKLLIPSLSVNGVASAAIQLQVSDRPQGSTNNQPLFVETELDKSSAYVQEQLLLTLRINASTSLQSMSSEELMIKDASVVKVSENQYQKQINGINHLVVELKYAVFPNTSGKLTIPALRFNAVIPDRRDPYSNSFFSRGGKRVILYSDEKTVTINPRPTSYGSAEWLPTTAVSLSERWSRPLDELVAGEPITRTIYLSAQGLTAAQLPPLEINAGDGFKVYPDQPQLNNDVNNDGVMATRSESVAMVPSRGGTINLPAITVQWWDTASNQLRETVLEGKTLSVKPAENTMSAPEPIIKSPDTTEIPLVDKQPSSLIFWLLLISNLLLLGVSIIFWLLWRGSRHQAQTEPGPPQEPSGLKETKLFNNLKQQAESNDLQAFRSSLLIWAGILWQRPLVTLDDVAAVADNPLLTSELLALDRALYSPDTPTEINLRSLLGHLKVIRKQPKLENAIRGNHLQPLYASG